MAASLVNRGTRAPDLLRSPGAIEVTDEEVACALRQVDGGTPVADVCRQTGISKTTFYVWMKKYA